MNKRVFCNLLVLVLLLGMLPTAAIAGGGSSIVWSEDFSADDALATWTVIDANNDGYGFIKSYSINVDPCETLYYAASPQGYGGNEGTGASSDDYLISPVIDLAVASDEYELSYDCRVVRPEEDNTPQYTQLDVFVVDSETPLTVQDLRNLPVRCFAFEAPHDYMGWTTCRYDLTAYAGRQIRLVFHHRDSSANQLQLDNFQILDWETDQHVERIAVVNVPEPEIGLSVQDINESDIRILDSENLSLVPGSLIYRKTVNESGVPVTGDFEEGAEYTIEFQLRANEGCFTYDNAIASVNGRRAYTNLDNNGTPDNYADDVIAIFFDFGYLYSFNECIEHASVFVTPPVLGKAPDYHVQPNQDSFTLSGIYWCEMNDDGTEGPVMAETDHYESGKEYRCAFQLKPCDGYYFPDKPQIFVNDETKGSINPDSDGAFWFHVNYTAVDNENCTIRFCTDTDNHPADVSGRVGEQIILPSQDDQPSCVFAGWSYVPWGGAYDVVPASFRITKSCTLYAIWLDILDEPEVGISTPGVYESPRNTRVIIDKYANYVCDSIAPGEAVAWWKDPAQVGRLNKRYTDVFMRGATYYGQAYLQADENHCFAADMSGLKLYGAVLDEAVAEGNRLKLTFHVTMPGPQTVNAAEFFVDSLIPYSTVDENFELPISSLTPGLTVNINAGLYPSMDDAYSAQNAYVGFIQGGETYYASADLESSIGAAIDPEIKFTVHGASSVARGLIDEYSIKVIFAVKIMDTYDFEARAVSTDGSIPCGYFRSDYHSYWSNFIEGPFTRGGAHWLKTMAEPGYVFLEWQTKDGETISTDDPYFYTLDQHMAIQAVFAPGYTVRFLTSHGDDVPNQIVAAGECAVEPVGLTATDFIFQGWFTDPACADADKYDFSKPITGNLILYSGWKYSPGMSTDKTELNKAVADAEKIETIHYTDETVAAFQQALADAKEVQADPTVSQDTVNGVLDDLNNAVFGLKLKTDEFLFEDVKDPAKFYFDPVYWAYYADPQITKGIDDTHFGPDNPCTRGQVVTFLWRAAGCPEPVSTETSFKDLKADGFYVKAVAWAVENEITNGITPDKFGPDGKCTRGQIVTFLWRFKGRPAPMSTATSFKDLKADGFYLEAVAWAVENEITNGLSADKFGPDETCTRGQVVTFLYRATKS